MGFDELPYGNSELTTAANVEDCADQCSAWDEFECRGFMFKEGDSGDPSGYFADGACTLLDTLEVNETGHTGVTSGRMLEAD